MGSSEVYEVRPHGVTWFHIIVFAIVTGICTILAVYAVIVAPVPGAPGVSGLYIAAGVYVPVSLWFGIWGCLAGYLSCLFMGIWVGMPMPLHILAIWSLADFFEGFVPLAVFRVFNLDVELKMKNSKTLAALLVILLLDLVVSALALTVEAIGRAWVVTILGLEFSVVFLATAIVAFLVLIAIAIVTRSASWVAYIIFGIIGASLVSALIGAYGLCASGLVPWELYPIIFFGWAFGDMIVLATIGTTLMVVLTPVIKRSYAYVRGWFS